MSSSAPELLLRPPHEEETDAILEVLNVFPRLTYGSDDMSESELRLWLTSPTVDVERDIRVVERDGRLTSYADVGDQSELHTRYWIDLRYHPELVDQRDLKALLEWAEERAYSDADPGALLRAYVDSKASLALQAVDHAGFDLIRHSYRMEIELKDRAEPVWPEEFELATFQEGQAKSVYDAHMESFEDSWEHTADPYEEWEHWSFPSDFDPTLWFLARDGDEIAGVALCRFRETDHETGWVSVLGVRRRWRRRGLGRALLEHAFGEFARRGCRKVGLGVDAESLTGANRLYESAGMRVVRQFDIFEKPLT